MLAPCIAALVILWLVSLIVSTVIEVFSQER